MTTETTKQAPMLSIADVAEGLSLSVQSVRNLVHDGAINAVMVGGVFRIEQAEVRRVRENGTSRRKDN